MKLSTMIYLSFFVLFLTSPIYAQMMPTSAKPWMGVAIDQGKIGVLVKQAIPGTPAELAGIQTGDEILSVNEQIVKTPNALIELVTSLGVGNQVKVSFTRGNTKKSLTLTLVVKPEMTELLKKMFLDIKAPDFDLPVVFGDASGKLQALKGKVVLIKFWATWCPACRASLPSLHDFASKNKNISVLAISEDETSVIKDFFKKDTPSFTVLSSKDKDTSTKYNVVALPTLFVIDQEGMIRFAEIGGGIYLEEAEKKALSLVKNKLK